MGLSGLHVGLQGCLPAIWSEDRSALSSAANRLSTRFSNTWKHTHIQMADSLFTIRNGTLMQIELESYYLERFTSQTMFLPPFCSTSKSMSVCKTFPDSLCKQSESSKNGVTRAQLAQMKQNANTPVTQLQYFFMHMLQICLVKTTSVFIQCHPLDGGRGSSSFFWHTSQQSAEPKTFPPSRGIWTWDNCGWNNSVHINTQTLPS